MEGLSFSARLVCVIVTVTATVKTELSKPPGPEFVSRQAHMKEVSGTTVVFECVIENLPSNKPIMWRREKDMISMNSEKVTGAERFRVTVKDNLPPGQRGYELEIDGLLEKDEGEYGCFFYDGDKKIEQLSSITIVVPPTITNVAEDLDRVVIEGNRLELFCNASGKPEPNITWTKLDINGLPGHVQVDGKKLIFTRVSRKDHGEYKCLASNGAGTNPATFFDVTVHYQPTIKVGESTVLTGPNKIARLSCTIDASPSASVTWRVKGSPVDDRPNMQQENRYDSPKLELESVLTIQAVSKEDLGNYSCYATNKYGNATGNITVTALPTAVGIVARERSQYPEQFPLTWKVSSADRLEKYILSYRTYNETSQGPWINVSIDPTQADDVIQHVQSHVIEDLIPNTKYQVKVQAHNSVGAGQYSDVFTFTTADEFTTLPPSNTEVPGYEIKSGEQKVNPGGHGNGASAPAITIRLLLGLVCLSSHLYTRHTS